MFIHLQCMIIEKSMVYEINYNHLLVTLTKIGLFYVT